MNKKDQEDRNADVESITKQLQKDEQLLLRLICKSDLWLAKEDATGLCKNIFKANEHHLSGLFLRELPSC